MSSEYYAIQWFLTLYAIDLPQPVVRRIWDRFLVAGWRVIAQVGLVLLYRIQDALLEMVPSFKSRLRVLRRRAKPWSS